MANFSSFAAFKASSRKPRSSGGAAEGERTLRRGGYEKMLRSMNITDLTKELKPAIYVVYYLEASTTVFK